MTKVRQKLDFLLARCFDVPRAGQPGASDAEWRGAMDEVVRRLRLMYQAGETDLVLGAMTREEAEWLRKRRERAGEDTTSGTQRERVRRKPSVKETLEVVTGLAGIAERLGFFDDAPPDKDPEDDDEYEPPQRRARGR
jgi:hypothetical protein